MFLSFPLIPFTLLTISIVAVITFYLAKYNAKRSAFDKLLLWAIFYIFLHSFYVFNVEIFCPNEPWKDQLMPFALVYGPFLFFGTLSLRDSHVRIWEVIIHLIPFIIYFIFFLCMLFGVIENSYALQQRLAKHIYILGPLSFMAYSIWSTFASKKVFKGKYARKKMLFVFARILLLFLSLILIILFFSKPISGNQKAVYFIRMIVYSCMLVSILMILSYVIDGLLRLNKSGLKSGVKPVLRPVLEVEKLISKPDLMKYERSALNDDQLDLYQQKLIFAIKEEKLYLNQELSLSSLSSHLRIPNHHLTQVFSMRIQQTFYQYINGFRIVNACNLLKLPGQTSTLEELAEQSGFNSKASFNRQFKLIMGCTPSEYRQRLN